MDNNAELESGKPNKEYRGRRHFAEMYGVTVRMMRSEENRIKWPTTTKDPGQPSLFSRQDHVTIGFSFLNRAIAGSVTLGRRFGGCTSGQETPDCNCRDAHHCLTWQIGHGHACVKS